MVKKKNLAISLSILALIITTGCSNHNNELEVSDVKSNVSGENIKKYNKLKVDDAKEIASIPGIKKVELVSDTANNISLKNADEIKSLLGNNIELISLDDNSIENKGLYSLKGYERGDEKSIALRLNEDIEDKFIPANLGIFFSSRSKDLTKSLDMFLEMEDKISLMLNNLLEKDEAMEVLSFLKEEISRIKTKQKSAFEHFKLDDYESYKTGFMIMINDDTSLGFDAFYDEKEGHSISFGLVSSYLINKQFDS